MAIGRNPLLSHVWELANGDTMASQHDSTTGQDGLLYQTWRLLGSEEGGVS